VLIADDNRDAAESLAMLLELAGHEVRVADHGKAALAVAQVFRPDMAVLDIGMPDMSGYEVARALRAEPWATGVTLIALTGWGQDSDRRRAIEAGFDHHLIKPVDPDRLAELIVR
jgi:CheY-like chemotaxis protein